MRRTPTAAEDLPESTQESTTALIARLSAEHGLSSAESGGRRRHSARPVAAGAVVSRHSAPRRRPTVRRIAPLAVGAAVVLVATIVLTTVRSSPEPTTLADRSDVASSSTTSEPQPTTEATAEPTLALIAPSATAAAAPSGTRPARSAAPQAAPTTRTSRTAPPQAQPAASRPVVPPAGDGAQAATAHGWTLATADEFTGNALSSHWGPYDGAGNDGDGRRTPDAITVQNGILTIRGDAHGTSGGMAWSADQRFGKWEVRARFPKGDRQYHPVLLLWPQGEWPRGGEVDFAETTSASSDVEFFLHYSSSNKQKDAQESLDLTQWHNYAVEWVDGRITGYVDGQQWFESTDSATLPPGQMHLAIQLDYFPGDGSPKPTEMDVDYVRIYR